MPVDMEVSLRKQLEKSICSEGKGLEGKMIRVFLDGTRPLMEFEKQVTDWSDVDADFSHKKQLRQLK